MSASAPAPGLSFTVAQRPTEPSPLRSDVAGFLGRARRGPVGAAVRVEGWRGYLRTFGGLDRGAVLPYALRSYFENGGQVAWVVRLAGPGVQTARGTWELGKRDPVAGWNLDLPVGGRFRDTQYEISATSPGAWANGTRVAIRYRLRGASGGPEVDLTVEAPGEPTESILGLRPEREETFEAVVAATSALIRLRPAGAEPPPLPPNNGPGPRRLDWPVVLAGGFDAAPRLSEYLAALDLLGEQGEVALVATPDLYADLAEDGERRDWLAAAIRQAEERRDRLVLVDLPGELEPEEIVAWLDALRLAAGVDALRAAAAYHPSLKVSDPLGSLAEPLVAIPPSGPVAGLISRLDRERGAHHTPANAPLVDALDLAQVFAPEERGRLNAAGVNVVQCLPGRGFHVWGGRTLDLEARGPFVAHRRLVHRLVRAIRRVAEPLVFDIIGPELWLALARAVTSVLLAAYRAGALRGARPEEAFRVHCDESNNQTVERDAGRVLCEIELAPATPMEFITLRIALGREGELEVFEP